MADRLNAKSKVFIRSFGCQMNARDSEFVAGHLCDKGFKIAGSIDKADVVIFNSCSVRQHAEDRLFNNILELRELKEKRPGLIVGLMGCTAQVYKGQAAERAAVIDFVCGPGNESDIPKIIEDLSRKRRIIVATDKVDDRRPELFPKYRSGKFKGYVSISEGCDNFCSYCIVPYVRGRERSREAKDIIREVRDLAARGFKEIILLGQNVNSYGNGFVKLLEKLNTIKGIERIRFMTSHPKDVSTDLFKAMRDLEKVCEHLHLPLQSGSDRILRLMNRKYTRKKYLGLAESYKKIVPGGSITTDVIAGFPSESEGDFRKTMYMMRRIGFDSAFTFKYSSRPFTRSAKLKDDVPEEVKSDRLTAMLDLQTGISLKRNKLIEGHVVEVLVDGINKKDRSTLTGRTRSNKVAVFKGGKDLIGKLVNVRIDVAAPYVLRGRSA